MRNKNNYFFIKIIIYNSRKDLFNMSEKKQNNNDKIITEQTTIEINSNRRHYNIIPSTIVGSKPTRPNIPNQPKGKEKQ